VLDQALEVNSIFGNRGVASGCIADRDVCSRDYRERFASRAVRAHYLRIRFIKMTLSGWLLPMDYGFPNNLPISPPGFLSSS